MLLGDIHTTKHMWEEIVAAWNAVPEVLSEGVGWLMIQLTPRVPPPSSLLTTATIQEKRQSARRRVTTTSMVEAAEWLARDLGCEVAWVPGHHAPYWHPGLSKTVGEALRPSLRKLAA